MTMTFTDEAEAPTSTTGLSVSEMSESLTGFEEIAVSKAFGKEIGDLPGTQPLRALVMVWHKRDGLDDSAAYQAAMNLSLKGCTGFFDADDEINDDQPETPAGKEG